MLDQYFESPFTLEQLRNGPSGPLLGGFARSLHEDGYSWWTARTYLRAAHHLGHFLQSEGIALVALQPDTIAVFRRHLKHCRCPKPRGRKTEDTVRGAKCFLRYLWDAGTVPRPTQQPWPPLVQEFSDWLKIHRGASETTLSRYSAAAIELLSELGSDPGQYDAECLRAFLLERARRRGVGGDQGYFERSADVSALSGFSGEVSSRLGRCHPDDGRMAFGLITALPVDRRGRAAIGCLRSILTDGAS